MKRIILALAAATVLSSPAFAAKIGVSMDKFDDNFLTVLRNSMAEYAKTQPDHRQSRRHLGDRGHHQGRRRRRRAARLRQPRAHRR
jgi:hypothetical protein